MLDHLDWLRRTYQRHLLDLEDEGELGEDDYLAWQLLEDLDRLKAQYDQEPPLADLARLAVDIEAGRAQPPPGWQLDRPSPGILVWSTPAGRRHACDLTGELLPLP